MNKLFVLFVSEGNRLASEGKLLEAIISLKNACACSSCDTNDWYQLDAIIVDMSRKYRFGGKR